MLIYLIIWKVNPRNMFHFFKKTDKRNSQWLNGRFHWVTEAAGTVAHQEIRSGLRLAIKQQAMRLVCTSLFQTTSYINYILRLVFDPQLHIWGNKNGCLKSHTVLFSKSIIHYIHNAPPLKNENFIECFQQYFQSPYTGFTICCSGLK